MPVELGPDGFITVHELADLTITDLHVNAPSHDASQMIIEPTGRVTINGQIQNQDQENDLNILIKGNGNDFGSIIHTEASIRASIRVDRNIASQWEMLSMPLQDLTISQDVIQGMVYSWSEPLQGWTNLNGQINVNTETDQSYSPDGFTPGLGYLQQLSKSDGNRLPEKYTGKLVSGPVHLHLSKKATSQPLSGYNLLGNPYASSIDWKSSAGWSGREQLDGGMDQGVSVWVWNPHTGNYGAYNNASSSNLGTNQVSRYIAPMQAFWVEAATDGAEIIINNKAKVHSDQKTLKHMKNQESSVISLLVSNHTNVYSDEVILEFGNHVHHSTKKMFSMLEEAPSLYVNNQREPMSIYSMDAPQTTAFIPIGFEAGISALHTITVSGFSNIEGNIYLMDNLTGHRHDLKKNESYHFMGNPWDEADRFMLQFGEDISTSVNEASNEKADVYYYAHSLHITNPWSSDATIWVYNTSGAAVTAFDVPALSTHQQPFSERPGVYIVRVSGQGSEDVTKRVAIL